jgi:hypothetical protein
MTRRALAHSAIASIALLLATRDAHAQRSPTARLDVERGPGAEVCPDADALRSAVAARIGRDPFDPDAARILRVRITRTARNLISPSMGVGGVSNILTAGVQTVRVEGGVTVAAGTGSYTMAGLRW